MATTADTEMDLGLKTQMHWTTRLSRFEYLCLGQVLPPNVGHYGTWPRDSLISCPSV